MIHKFIIKIKDYSFITVYTDIEMVINKFLSKKSIVKTIPAIIIDCGIVSEIDSTINYLSIFSSNEIKMDINKIKNIANLFISPTKLFFPDIVYLLIGMLANDLQSKQMYFMQSAVIKYDEKKSIMLLGNPNAGKTSLAYSLIKGYNYDLISNDNVLVKYTEKGLKTICGTKAVQMRLGAIENYFPEILPYIEIEDENKFKNKWDIKIYIDNYLKKNNIECSDDSIINEIYNINTFDNEDSSIKEVDEIDQILLIHEHLTKQIRSNRYALISFNQPLPSFEDEKYLLQRYEMANKICYNTSIYDARGSIKDLALKIGDKHGKK